LDERRGKTGPADLRSRAARPGDAEAVARIYNQGIEERIATFETRPRAGREILGWFDDGHPIVVVERGGAVISFANASAYSPRECYSGVAEFSVYTAREARGLGAGTLAMEALISEPSLNLLLSLGFREVGVHEKHARLDGVWRDVVVVERLLPSSL
jgi:phosphinothricin acetyltransferase